MNRKAIGCEHRDGYLGRWLMGPERIEFEAHVADCPDCRRVVQEQQRLDDLLARAHTALVLVPPRLLDRIDHRLRRARWRRAAAWTTGWAAAGLLLCALAVWFLSQRTPEHGAASPPMLTKGPPPPEPRPEPCSLVQVTVPPPSDVIPVPHKTGSTSVTIIWLYPIIKAVQEPNPAPSGLFQPPERNGI